MRKLLATAAVAVLMAATGTLTAAAQDTIKIAYIDPLSGPGATVGEVGLKTFQFLADELNAKGGAAGKKFEILPFDNKTNPQESLVQVQKAVDAGCPHHHAGQRLIGGCGAVGLGRQVQRAQPRQGSDLPQLCRRRSGAHQRQVQFLRTSAGTPTPTSRWRR